ncbi:hypothetical protein BB8028_0002g04090 [Beauveria bassiana]|uniref:Uncharacterized protein n=1 Tax=Beauveria bassiana TaxID=176275 RepID=A0A2S7Y1P3_BEABA|nr:hypothetical protein BB8028_0002g04090 [Beauveria bassiana]
MIISSHVIVSLLKPATSYLYLALETHSHAATPKSTCASASAVVDHHSDTDSFHQQRLSSKAPAPRQSDSPAAARTPWASPPPPLLPRSLLLPDTPLSPRASRRRRQRRRFPSSASVLSSSSSRSRTPASFTSGCAAGLCRARGASSSATCSRACRPTATARTRARTRRGWRRRPRTPSTRGRKSFSSTTRTRAAGRPRTTMFGS